MTAAAEQMSPEPKPANVQKEARQLKPHRAHKVHDMLPVPAPALPPDLHVSIEHVDAMMLQDAAPVNFDKNNVDPERVDGEVPETVFDISIAVV